MNPYESNATSIYPILPSGRGSIYNCVKHFSRGNHLYPGPQLVDSRPWHSQRGSTTSINQLGGFNFQFTSLKNGQKVGPKQYIGWCTTLRRDWTVDPCPLALCWILIVSQCFGLNGCYLLVICKIPIFIHVSSRLLVGSTPVLWYLNFHHVCQSFPMFIRGW